jgi:PAS domain S-box-containing protein
MKLRYILFFLVVIIGFCSFLFTSFYNQAKQEAIKNINNEQLLHARHAARGIEDFFNNWTRTLTFLSESKSVIDMDETGKKNLRLLYNANQDKIRAISRVDAAGRIVYTFPFTAGAVGKNISQQSHVREIMRTHKPVVSDVFYAVQGYDSVALHVPVFRNKVYHGTIAVSVNFKALAKRYLEDIRIGDTGYAWMISRDGTELYCPVPGHTGKSVFENCKDFPSILAMAEDMLKGSQGTAIYAFDKVRGDKVEIVKKYAVFMPINLGSTFWSVVVATSEDEIIASLENFRNKLIGVIGLLLLGGVLFSYFGLKASFIIEEEKKRRRSEDALLESEERFRAFMENMPSMAIIKDQELKPLFFNRKFSEMFPADEWLGKIPEEAFPAEIADAVRKNDLKAFSEGFVTYEEAWRDKDGCIRVLETRKFSIDQKDKAPLLGVIITDVTERTQHEKALLESEAKYRTLIETTNTGFVIIDEKGVVLDANPEYVRLSGHARLGEIIGKSVIEWTADYERQKNAAAVGVCLHNRQIRSLEIDYVDSEGKITPIEINATCMETEGMTQILTLCRNITERRHAEEERKALEERLSRAEKMEALGTLAGGVAHDLNNVLGVLVGYSELLAEKLPENTPLRKYADNIMRSSMRGAAIIQDLLTLARRGVNVSEVVDLNRVVSDYLKTPEFGDLKSHHPQVKMRTELEEGLLLIKGSPVHLSKTIMNLVSNAAEAISGRGEVTIRTENRYLDQSIQGYDDMKEGDYVVLTVSDTGMGISAHDMGKIFEPFYTKKVMGRSGTGLGLAVVWGSVKDHRGYIDVVSEEGRGSTFTLYFPVTREGPAQAEKAASPVSYMGKGESILVVDDVKEQRDLAASMLGRLGYRVDAVAGGEEAIAYLKDHKADLLVLDMIMDPGIDGMETYRRILEIHPAQKAIIVSGFSETDRIRQAQDMGAGAFVRKPYILEKIGLAVKNELARK